MNWLDVVLGIVFVLSLIVSVRQGLIREAASLIGLIAGLLIASRLYRQVAAAASDSVGEGPWVTAASFAVVFLIVYLGILLISHILARSLHMLRLRWLDRLLGGVFGALRGAVLIVFILITLMLLLSSRQPNRSLRGSWIYQHAEPGIVFVGNLLPEAVAREIQRRDAVHRGSGRRHNILEVNEQRRHFQNELKGQEV
ncbi:MAG: hypothetical protein GF355_11775 [Candidatus Eisenbacteria bacterium]|nr:hypothetical protein [Candidatus Eisenbacteria bacterium]